MNDVGNGYSGRDCPVSWRNCDSEELRSAAAMHRPPKEIAKDVRFTASAQLDGKRIVRIKPGVAIGTFIAFGKRGLDFGGRVQMEQPSVCARLGHNTRRAIDAVA